MQIKQEKAEIEAALKKHQKSPKKVVPEPKQNPGRSASDDALDRQQQKYDMAEYYDYGDEAEEEDEFDKIIANQHKNILQKPPPSKNQGAPKDLKSELEDLNKQKETDY
jgi:hypothetical protein